LSERRERAAPQKRKMNKTLNQRVVTKYAKFNALKNHLEKWLKPRREEIVQDLKAGAKCPDAGPYLLELSPAVDRINWREKLKAHVMAQFRRSEEWAEAYVVEIEAGERATAVRLLCKVNPQFEGRLNLRLPR
jgi:hypothetical protein